jgi:outer membrane translocation and assembly module TamA
MVSQVGICNLALKKISQETISSIDEDEGPAILLKQIWEPVRDRCLRLHTWNFATQRQTLARLSDTPGFEYAYYYQLPADFLREDRLYDNNYLYKIEGERLLTDAEAVYLIYIAKITDTQKYDALFVDFFATVLAAELARALTGSDSTTERLTMEAREKLKTARRIDGQHGTPEALVTRSDLSDSFYTLAGGAYVINDSVVE